MANETDLLNQLKVYVVQTGATAPSISDWKGVLLFDEGADVIKVNNHEYGLSTSAAANISNIITGLSRAGYIAGDGSLTGAETSSVATLINNALNSTSSTSAWAFGEGHYDSVQDALDALELSLQSNITTEINKLDSTVYGAWSGTTGTGSTSSSAFAADETNQIAIEVTETDGKLTALNVKTKDIASAAALNTLDQAAVKTITVNGVTGTTTSNNASVTIEGADITVGGEGYGSGTSVAQALTDLSQAISAGGVENTLHLYTGESGTATATDSTVHADGSVYRLVQGSGAGTLIAKFNIEKDSFVKAGELVYGPEGLPGSTSTAAENESATPTGTATTPYLKLVIKTTDDDIENYVYIPATSLVDVYTGTAATAGQAGGVSVLVEDHTISASLVSGAVTGAHIATGAVTGANIASGTVTGANIASGTITTDNLTSSIVTSLGAADTAVQEVNGVSGTSVTIDGTNILVGGTGTGSGTSVAQAIYDLKQSVGSVISWNVISAGA